MMENLVNLNDFEINRESAKMILENNTIFKNDLEDTVFDIEYDYVKDNFLNLLPNINYDINVCSTNIYINSSDIYELLAAIVDNSETWKAYLDNTEILIQKMEVYREVLWCKCSEYSNRYYRVENHVTELIEKFLEILENHIESITDTIDDIENLADWFVDSGYLDNLTWSGMYINPKTFELYELKHQ